jgi:predicted transcriptional regulator
MRVEEYMWRHELKEVDFANQAGIARSTLRKILKYENVTWKAIQAVVLATKGKVAYEDLETHKKPKNDCGNKKEKKG